MATTLTVTNLGNTNITLSNPVGVVPASSTVVFQVTVAELENLADELAALDTGGYITFTTGIDEDASAAELATSVLTAGQALDTATAQQVGPNTVTLAATQTNTVLALGAQTIGWKAPRAGSITAVQVVATAAPTTADVNFRVSINGTPVAGTAAILTFSPAISSVAQSFERNTYTFAAGDLIRLVYTSGGIGNTPGVVAFFEVTC